MVFRTNSVDERRELHPHAPTDRLPVQTYATEFSGFRALIAIGDAIANGYDPSIYEGEYKIVRRNLFHEFIEGVSGSIRIALRRPEIATRYLLSECLVLVYPPVAHVSLLRRFLMS
jgi:hypothetical protein